MAASEVAATPTDPVPRRARRFRWRVAFWGALAGLLLALGVEVYHVLIGQNFHTVVPGRVYRSAQLSETDLEEVIRRQGIRTVVNLRGFCDPYPWYLDESRATHHLNVDQEDICLSACRLPSMHEVRRIVEVLDRTAYPILLHCRRGSDRTGLVSALCVLWHTDAGLSEASHQLGPRYAHFPLGRPKYLDEFLSLYADWLHGEGLAHSPAVLRRWLTDEYCPAECRCVLTPIEMPSCVRKGEPTAVRVRAQNTSVRPWHFTPGTTSGIHAGYILADKEGRCLMAGRAGLFDAEVAPGASIDLTLTLPGIAKPGVYSLMVDMVDEQQCWFFQTGCEPLQGGVGVTE
jgi:protein tyrosine phosphatase (PTP) superfamily phosphohydrolase (DUF442 family)